MTPLLFLALAALGGLGAATRFVLDGLIRARVRTGFPWATTLINASGSLLLGLLTGLALAQLAPEPLALLLGAGFLGGYTTFSTASAETVRLLRARRYAASLLSGVGMLVLCVALAAAGLWLGASALGGL